MFSPLHVFVQTHQLIALCGSPLVEQGVSRYEMAKKGPMNQPRPVTCPGDYLTVDGEVPTQPSPEKSWKWSGTDFIKSPTEEPWVRFF